MGLVKAALTGPKSLEFGVRFNFWEERWSRNGFQILFLKQGLSDSKNKVFAFSFLLRVEM